MARLERGLDKRMNGKIGSLPEHHGDSGDLRYLVFYSYPLTLFFFFWFVCFVLFLFFFFFVCFFFFNIPADFYFSTRIRHISQHDQYNSICLVFGTVRNNHIFVLVQVLVWQIPIVLVDPVWYELPWSIALLLFLIYWLIFGA